MSKVPMKQVFNGLAKSAVLAMGHTYASKH